MTDGLSTTWNVLTQTSNRAAQPLLAIALRSQATGISTGAIRTSVRRKDATAHQQVIRLFATLGEAEQFALCVAHRETPHRMAAALTEAVLDGDAVLCENACRIIVQGSDYDRLSILVRAAENCEHRHASQVNAALLLLAGRLHQDLAETESNKTCGARKAFFLRRQVVRTLERSLTEYARHQRQEILEAFLVAAPADNLLLQNILQDPHHPCHRAALASLRASKTPATMDQLIARLNDSAAHFGVLTTIALRTDRRFVELLLHNLKQPLSACVLQNMSRLKAIDWLEADRELLLELDGRAQATAVELAMASDLEPAAVFGLLAMLLQRGMTEARRASCRALAEFRGRETDSLVVAALDDPDTGVRAAAVAQLRQRQLPDALPMLVKFLGAAAIEVRDAARSSLAEFNFFRYRAMFDLLDEKTLRTTGVLVIKVDPSACFRLAEELTSPSATTRRRAIAMAIAMEATNDVHEQLIALSEDEDVGVRLEAVGALAQCHGREVASALRLATQDPHRVVREAARKSLLKVRSCGQSVIPNPPVVLSQP